MGLVPRWKVRARGTPAPAHRPDPPRATPPSAAQASKLAAALHKLLEPLARKTAPPARSPGSPALLVPALQVRRAASRAHTHSAARYSAVARITALVVPACTPLRHAWLPFLPILLPPTTSPQAALEALPAWLPGLCLCIKAMGLKVRPSAARQSAA